MKVVEAKRLGRCSSGDVAMGCAGNTDGDGNDRDESEGSWQPADEGADCGKMYGRGWCTSACWSWCWCWCSWGRGWSRGGAVDCE